MAEKALRCIRLTPISCRAPFTVPRCGSPCRLPPRYWHGERLALGIQRGPLRASARPLTRSLFDAVGEPVVLLGDVEQIAAQQSAFRSLGGVPDEPRSFSALLGGRVQQVSAISHTSRNAGERKGLHPSIAALGPCGLATRAKGDFG